MSLEQRMQAYYKRYHSYGRGHSRLLLDMARIFKTPIREIKDMLDIKRKPPYPEKKTGCPEEKTGDCLGRLGWYWIEDHWESRCTIHYPNWEELRDKYGERWREVIEDRHIREHPLKGK